MRLFFCICCCLLFSPGALSGELWTCELRDQTIDCRYRVPDTRGRSPILEAKMASAMESLKAVMPSCSVTAFASSGETVSTESLMISSIEIYNKYKCLIKEDSMTAQRRIATENHAHDSLDCTKELFKSYAHGFDIYVDGSRSHWDTLTQQLPWRPIGNEPINSKIHLLFEKLCQ
jgi:hypothetical protein